MAVASFLRREFSLIKPFARMAGVLAWAAIASSCSPSKPATDQTAADHHDHGTTPAAAAGTPGHLDHSPRHHEWVTVRQGDRQVQSYVVYPEKTGKATAVILIHENRGLTDWERGLADQLAAAGYIAIAPDLLSGAAPGGGKTSDFASGDAAREAIYALPPQQVTADLKAVRDYVVALPAANGKVAVAGFCWGGSQAFRMATTTPGLGAAFVFYGTGPDDKAAVSQIQVPVYGFYGGNDARVNASIPKTAELMREAGKTYEPVVYDGAGHAYMRSGEAPDASAANKAARDQSLERLLGLLRDL